MQTRPRTTRRPRRAAPGATPPAAPGAGIAARPADPGAGIAARPAGPGAGIAARPAGPGAVIAAPPAAVAATPGLARRGALGLLLLAAPLLAGRRAHAQPAPTLLRIVGPRDEVVIGLTAAELEALGSGPAVERVARALVAQGQLTAWQYVVGRAPDGTTRLATTRRIAILRNDALRVEPYAPALPVAPPPGP